MKIISTETVEQGQVAAQDIHSSSGNVLVLKGTALSPALGKRLKNWGIDHIHIEGEDESEQENAGAYVVSGDKIRDSLAEKFGDTLNNARMKKIFEAVYTHKTQNRGGV